MYSITANCRRHQSSLHSSDDSRYHARYICYLEWLCCWHCTQIGL